MKLSETTLLIWANMVKINPHLVIEKGCKVRTIDSNGATLFEYIFEDEVFPNQIAFHDLGEFLKVVSLFDEPNFDFKEDKVIISDSSGTTQTYYYSETTELIYNNKTPRTIDYSILFSLKGELLSKALSASTINTAEDIAFVGENGDLFLKVLDKEETNPEISLTESKRVFSILIDDTKKYPTFTAFLKHSKKAGGKRINVLPLEQYQVSISEVGAINLIGELDDRKLSYTMALVSDSKF